MNNNIGSSLLAGSIVGGAVAVERILSKSKIETVLEATTLQSLQTAFTAYIFIHIYDLLLDDSSSMVNKTLVINTLGISSGFLNYQLQENIGGSVVESFVMYTSSVVGLIAHEYKLPKRLGQGFRNIKIQLGK